MIYLAPWVVPKKILTSLFFREQERKGPHPRFHRLEGGNNEPPWSVVDDMHDQGPVSRPAHSKAGPKTTV